MNSAKILVVEDEASIRNIVRTYLENAGFVAVCVDNGPDALTLARQHNPDLIILDLNLPGMDGIEVAARLRQESDAYILMLTARSEESDRVAGLRIGADDYLTKPFSPRELVARVEAILRRSRALAEADASSLEEEVATLLDSVRRSILTAVIVGAIGAIIAGLVTSYLLAREILRPLDQIATSSERIARGHYNERIAAPPSDELALVAENFNQMAESLERVESGQISLHLADFDLNPEIRRVVAQLRPQAEAQMLTIVCELGETAVPVHADLDRVAQVLLNLLGNAIRYTPDGGVITVSTHEKQNVLQVDVADTGMGIPAEALPYIFERFYRVDVSRTRQSGGSGIGLTISRHLVWGMGGE